MKRLFVLLFLAVFSLAAFSQSTKEVKYDVITKLNGEEMQGTIKEVTDTEIKFSYKGESVLYSLKKTDVYKVVFSGGRTEIFTKPDSVPAQPSQPETPATTTATDIPAASADDRRNKVAVLPFVFVKDNQSMGDDMAYKVQDETYKYLVKHSPMYTIQDTRTTNALLIKAGVTRDKMRGFTMDEVCRILGVEFLLDGTVSQATGAQSNYSNSSSNTRENNKNTGWNTTNSGSSTTYNNIRTTVSISVFNDKNENVYNNSHQAVISSSDGAYANTLDYILKRSPFYKK